MNVFDAASFIPYILLDELFFCMSAQAIGHLVTWFLLFLLSEKLDF